METIKHAYYEHSITYKATVLKYVLYSLIHNSDGHNNPACPGKKIFLKLYYMVIV